jgi:quercetin dioxygenase-like cupin family protein
MEITDQFESGKICTSKEIINSSEVDFKAHPKFTGVSLKHLVTGKLTNGQISCHLVKIEPHCVLETHVHEGNLEIHETIFGDGICEIGANRVNYTVGTIGVIPENVPHKVVAGAKGMYILAKFTPALN